MTRRIFQQRSSPFSYNNLNSTQAMGVTLLLRTYYLQQFVLLLTYAVSEPKLIKYLTLPITYNNINSPISLSKIKNI